MGSSEEVKFLSGGLLHYPLAATAVSRFKGMVYSQLEKGLARRWSSDGKPGRNDDVGDETYIELWRHVKLKTGDLATISIGLGWDTEGGYLYVYCQDGPEWAKHPNAPHFERDRQYSVLSRTCDPNNFDIARDIDAILDEFDDALQPSRSGTPPTAKRQPSART